MSSNLQNALIVFIYSALAGATLAAYHFGLIDQTLEVVLITGALGHMGLKYMAPSQNTPQQNVPSAGGGDASSH